jgi:ABC-2 type transport system ATP-binding protein
VSANGPAIEVRGLKKIFRTGFLRRAVPAVRGIDLTVSRGEILGFLGPNGAGKTTTIKMLMGLVMPTAGSGTILGEPLGSVAAKRRTGFLPESPYFYDYLTARELCELSARLAGVPSHHRRRRVDELLERVGLATVADRALRKFSKGMLQRAGIAQALVQDPELVVLDEPMSGLDPIGRKDVRDLILELKAAGKTVFFSTHILADVEVTCDRIAFIVGGALLDVGAPRSVLDSKAIGTEVVVRLPRAPDGTAAQLPLLESGVGSVRRVEDQLYALLPPDADVDAWVAAARSLDAQLISVTPRRESIEELFVRRARGASALEGGG